MKQKSPRLKSLITLTVMLVTILEVLDMTIVNVALPPMMGSLSANSEEITWVLTAYIVSAAIFMPLTGLLIKRIGQKTLLMINIIGFCLSSMLCGFASSLTQMVVFRIMQGLFGASLVPLSQYILRNIYQRHEQGKAMAIWGMGVMVAPVLGPTLGGYITEALTWRWVFFINLPVCLVALVLAFYFIEQSTRQPCKIDWLGLTLMMLSIGAFQLFLDQGNSKDWFESNLIQFLFLLTIVSTAAFIYHGLKTNNNIISLTLFTDRNFLLSSLLILGFMVCLFGIMAIQPMMLENLMGYPTEDAGLIMAPRALASAFMMAVVAKTISKINPKLLISTGLLLNFISSHLMASFELQTPISTMIWVGILQGCGMGLVFVPASMLALSTLTTSQTGEGSGLFSLARSIGSSIGISLISMVATRESQINWHSLSEHITATNPALNAFLANMQLNLYDPLTIKLISNKILLQANFNAFIDCYLLSSYGFLFLIPLTLFLKPSPQPLAVS